MISFKPVMMDPVEGIFQTRGHHIRCYIKGITGPHFSKMLKNMYRVVTVANEWEDSLLLMKCLYKPRYRLNPLKNGDWTLLDQSHQCHERRDIY